MKEYLFIMRKILIFSFFLLFNITVFSQISKMYFVSGGMSILTDVITTPGKTKQMAGYELNYQHFQWNYASFNLHNRINIANISDNATFSLAVSPILGAGMAYSIFDSGAWYSLGASVPAFFEFNYGAASRFKADKDYGFVVGAGYEYNIYPLYAYRVSDVQLSVNEFRKVWNQMVFEVGFRYWNKKNRVNEINFKLGYGEKGKEFIKFGGKSESEKQAMSFRLSFLRILNY